MKLLRFKRPERVSQDDLFSQLYDMAVHRWPDRMQETDGLDFLTKEQIDEQLAENLAKIADFHAANPEYVLTPEDAALEAEIQRVLREIARIEGRATEVRAPAAQEIPAPEIVPDQPGDPERKKDDTPAQEPTPEPIPEPAVKPAVDVASLPGYPPMSEAEAERELREYRARQAQERCNKNPLSWW